MKPPCGFINGIERFIMEDGLDVMRGGRRAVLCKYSLLDRLLKQPYHRRLIATAFNRLVHMGELHLYWRSNFDLYLLYTGKFHKQLELAIKEAQRAVEEDDTIQETHGDIKDPNLYIWYDLTQDFAQLFGEIEEINQGASDAPVKEIEVPKKPAEISKTAEVRETIVAALPDEKREKAKIPKAPAKAPKTVPQYNYIMNANDKNIMGPAELDKLERCLENIDMTPMLAEQQVCVVLPTVEPQVVFNEKYISVDEVCKQFLPKHNIAGDTWLFQRLTETFDKKMMKLGLERYVKEDEIISINSNISTVMSRAFDRFIARFKMNNHNPLILEIKIFDVLANIGAYFHMRDKLTTLGCRVCIEMMDLKALGVIDRKVTNVDFIKIPWKKEYKTVLSGPLGETILQATKEMDKMRIILTHCDDITAINFGQKLGIHMFQGHYIDALLK